MSSLFHNNSKDAVINIVFICFIVMMFKSFVCGIFVRLYVLGMFETKKKYCEGWDGEKCVEAGVEEQI